MIDGAEESGVEEATRFADDLLAGKGDTLAILKSIPTAIPKHITVDVSELAIGDMIRVGELKPMEGVTVLEGADRVIVHVTHPTADEPGTQITIYGTALAE
jgi:hypothetical protein